MPLIDVVHKHHRCVDCGLLPSFGSLHDALGKIKTSPWSGDIQLTLVQRPLSSLFEVHSIFSNRKLPSNSEEQSRTIIIVCIALGISLILELAIQKKPSHSWFWGFVR